jgi:hypothetical protein
MGKWIPIDNFFDPLSGCYFSLLPVYDDPDIDRNLTRNLRFGDPWIEFQTERIVPHDLPPRLPSKEFHLGSNTGRTNVGKRQHFPKPHKSQNPHLKRVGAD